MELQVVESCFEEPQVIHETAEQTAMIVELPMIIPLRAGEWGVGMP